MIQYYKFNFLLLFAIFIALIACTNENNYKSILDNDNSISRDSIIQKYVYDCADTYNYNWPEYQICLDSGIALDSTIAYLWQQKAMPYFKQMKYNLGMKYLDKAIKYDEKRWLSYRGFIKCIFQKDYNGAIVDFEKCIELNGNSYEMDHTYKFYIGLSYLQLNKYSEAEKILKKELDSAKNLFGDDATHHLDLFYYGISKYEQFKWEEAIIAFDKAIERYPQFSDAQHYKAICLYRIGEKEAGSETAKESMKNKRLGYTINEDNSIYERYPYQIY